MSSNHTWLMNSAWQEMQRRVEAVDAYVINSQAEAARITNQIRERERELREGHRANREMIRQSMETLAGIFNENVAAAKERMNAQLQTQAAGFSAQINDLREEVANTAVRISSLDSRIDSVAATYNEVFQAIASHQQSAEGRAAMVLSEIERLTALIEPLDPMRFSPVEYTGLVTLYESARANLQAGDPQAASMVSQNGVIRATRLLARLQLMNEQFASRETDIKLTALEIQHRIEELSSAEGVLTAEIAGEKEEYDYDISFWSRGRFDAITDDFKQLQELLNGGKLTWEQLNDVGQNLAVVSSNIDVCDAQARRERVGALIAADAALRLHNGLSQSNWTLEESGYASDDEREPYAMTYTDGAGNTVSVVVSPESTESPAIFMEVFSEDEELATVTKDGIHASLEEEGMHIGGREERNDCHLNPNAEAFIENAISEAQQLLRQRR